MDTILAVILCAFFWSVSAQPGTPLYEYVHRQDTTYSYELIAQYDQIGMTTYVLNMTSLTWFDEDFTSHPQWYHYLTIHIPTDLDPDFTNHAFLYISLGEWPEGPPDTDTRHVWETATYTNRTRMISASLKMIPMQPVAIEEDILPKTEDFLVAWTWRIYMESSGALDPEVLIFFPMCKATARAMDTITEFTSQELGPAVDIQSYMLSGESKRGWTTWLMPTVDDRVVAIAPIVLSCLNFEQNIQHYWKAMGNWTFAFGPYWLENITRYIGGPDFTLLEQQIDPFAYKEAITLPKLMISSASDEFFMPDDYNYYFDDLLGEKHILMLENMGHRVAFGPLYDLIWEQLETFYIAVIKSHPRPSFTWTLDTDPILGNGSIEVSTQDPADVIALMADTPASVSPRRDFRLSQVGADGLEDTGVKWNEYPVTDLGGGSWRVEFDKPDEGYRAFFLKLTFPFEDGRQFVMTTQTQVLSFDPSNPFPFEECYMEECTGSIV